MELINTSNPPVHTGRTISKIYSDRELERRRELKWGIEFEEQRTAIYEKASKEAEKISNFFTGIIVVVTIIIVGYLIYSSNQSDKNTAIINKLKDSLEHENTLSGYIKSIPDVNREIIKDFDTLHSEIKH